MQIKNELVAHSGFEDYLDHLDRTRYLAPQDIDLEPEFDEGLKKEDVWLETQ
jgi:hypothetical protein